jgi:hypothetical protein
MTHMACSDVISPKSKTGTRVYIETAAALSAQVNKKLEEVLTNKNSIIRALQFDVAKVSKAHNDLIRVYEAKLAEYGIPAGRGC